uniref:Uncharacterized protein n=1 Tax=Vitrella brassicaformis TaxID=1169539 RepID=A0A7S1KDC2_9ALVE|mmetsp:Transcript_49233/g.123402  ORF Transcript_49233/g.123402 Transcript_49233/m.123402 type:complete len:314 (+) Transcript_49233:98-1039(+)
MAADNAFSCTLPVTSATIVTPFESVPLGRFVRGPLQCQLNGDGVLSVSAQSQDTLLRIHLAAVRGLDLKYDKTYATVVKLECDNGTLSAGVEVRGSFIAIMTCPPSAQVGSLVAHLRETLSLTVEELPSRPLFSLRSLLQIVVAVVFLIEFPDIFGAKLMKLWGVLGSIWTDLTNLLSVEPVFMDATSAMLGGDVGALARLAPLAAMSALNTSWICVLFVASTVHKGSVLLMLLAIFKLSFVALLLLYKQVLMLQKSAKMVRGGVRFIAKRVVPRQVQRKKVTDAAEVKEGEQEKKSEAADGQHEGEGVRKRR